MRLWATLLWATLNLPLQVLSISSNGHWSTAGGISVAERVAVRSRRDDAEVTAIGRLGAGFAVGEPASLLALGAVRRSTSAMVEPEGYCAPAADFEKAMEGLEAELEALQLKLVAGLEKVAVEGQIESSSIADLGQVMEELERQLDACEHQAAEAREDVEAFERELQELVAIAQAEKNVVKLSALSIENWTSLSLLGERSVSVRSKKGERKRKKGSGQEVQVAADVKRAAEMHWGMVKAAQAAALCQMGQVSATGGDSQAAAATTTPSPMNCEEEYEKLREVYKGAYVHISKLLESAKVLAGDDACFQTAYAMLSPRQEVLAKRIQDARRGMCEGHLAGNQAEDHARKVQEALNASRAFLAPDCVDESWRRYEDQVGDIVRLALDRPKCEGCCIQNSTDLPASSWQRQAMAQVNVTANGDHVDWQEHRLEAVELRVADVRKHWHHAEVGVNS